MFISSFICTTKKSLIKVSKRANNAGSHVRPRAARHAWPCALTLLCNLGLSAGFVLTSWTLLCFLCMFYVKEWTCVLTGCLRLSIVNCGSLKANTSVKFRAALPEWKVPKPSLRLTFNRCFNAFFCVAQLNITSRDIIRCSGNKETHLYSLVPAS